MPRKIQLKYTEVLALAKSMRTAANNFQTNQKTLERNVNELRDNWSGNAANAMQTELRSMNKHVIELQDSLQGMAEFVEKAAEMLKIADGSVFR